METLFKISELDDWPEIERFWIEATVNDSGKILIEKNTISLGKLAFEHCSVFDRPPAN